MITVEEDPTLTPCQIVFSLEAGPLVSAGKRVTGWIPFSGTEAFAMEDGASNCRPVHASDRRTDGDVIHLQKWGWGRWMDMYMFDRESCGRIGAAARSRSTGTTTGTTRSMRGSPPWSPSGRRLSSTPTERSWRAVSRYPRCSSVMREVRQQRADMTTVCSRRSPFFQTGEEQLHAPPVRLLAYIIYGGAKFPIYDNAEGSLVASQGLTPLSQALILPQAEIDALPDTPVDFTLLAEMKPRSQSAGWDIGKRCVVYGGAKFEYTADPWYPNSVRFPAGWTALAPAPDNFGVKWRVNPISPAHFRDLPKMPHLGTLVREKGYPMVFRMGEDLLHHVPSVTEFQNLCLNWGNVRVVPDGSLDDLERSI